jgi:hypothetical protein
MKFVIIFGPQAVGKMTVGGELAKIADLKLFHNHQTIDLVSPFFGYDTESGKKLVNLFRMSIFEEVAKSNLNGLIFTYVWNFDDKNDWNYVEKILDIFRSQKAETYLVELETSLDERLIRNKHPYRLSQKPSKRNLEESEKGILESYQKSRLNSKIGEINHPNYIKIDNTNLPPEEVAKIIKERFKL